MMRKIDYLHFDILESTNTWAKHHYSTLTPHHLTCITASEQTKGRGRFDRMWVSPNEGNIYATLYFTIPRHTSYLQNVGQVLALSTVSCLITHGFHPVIKWPNDILLDRKKVAGILTETITDAEHVHIFLGIGINVNMSQTMLDLILQPATSLAQISGKFWPIQEILHQLVQQFCSNLDQLEENGFAGFAPHYHSVLAFQEERVRCHVGQEWVEGICDHIDTRGQLCIRLPNGEKTYLCSGEIPLS